jgi:2'-5' RNA ligase
VARSSRSSGRPGSPRARLFVALDLPGPERSELAAWRDRAIAGRRDLRPVAGEALHLTLAFLGYMPEKEIRRIADTAFGAVAGVQAPRLAARAVVPVPPRGRPRLFALDLEDPQGAAVAVQAAVSDALEAEGLYTPEKRPFWPHVTLARVKRDRRAPPLEAEPPELGVFQATDLTLYRSTLRPQGAVYEPLDRFRLGEGLRLRPARPQDIEAVAGVNVRAWQAAYRGLIADEVLDSLSPRQAMSRPDETETWVAERDDVLGYVSFGAVRQSGAGPETGEIYALYVDPSEWRRGIGRLLLERAVGRLRSLGFRRATLLVLQGNEPSRAFYEVAGWTPEEGPDEIEIRGVTVPVARYGLELA